MIKNNNQSIVTEEEGLRLVKIARLTIECYLNKRQMMFINANDVVAQRAGVFVTLFTRNQLGKLQLRGCIGNPFPSSSSIIDSLKIISIKAATEDPRFPPITSNELQGIIIEVSILTTPVLLDKCRNFQEKILIGKHGLIIESDLGSGLLLPQVAVEQEWNTIQFLENVCLKAGLDKQSWLAPGVRLYTFETLIFRERTPRGDIIPVGPHDE